MRDVDVAVIGAGYAGLATALAVRSAGRSVVVLEADERVGGRAWSLEQHGTLLDLGGQWAGPTQSRLLAWARRFGCATFPTYDEGRHLEVWPESDPLPYRSGTLPDAHGSAEYHTVLGRLDALAGEVDPDAPTRCPRLPEWDGRTLEDWLRSEVRSPDVRRRLRVVVQGLWACEPREISLFHALFYVASGGGLHSLLGTLGCAQDRRFAGGADAPARAAAAELGDAVLLSSPVTAVRWDGCGVEVVASDIVVRARRLVVTGTPPAQARIRFSPQLPLPRRRWLSRTPMGDAAKVHLTYPEPFWRADGLSGQLTCYAGGPVAYTFDNSRPVASGGVVVAFVYGDDYRRWADLPPDARRTEIVEAVAPLGAASARPTGYHEALWPEQAWAEGAYAAVPTPGTWLAHGRRGWREPVGPIHWAGTETASRWNGYIDGAIRSGERAAAEVVAALDAGARSEPRAS